MLTRSPQDAQQRNLGLVNEARSKMRVKTLSKARMHAINFFLVLLVVGMLKAQISEAAATYFVSQSGNDGNSCSQSKNQSTPKRTIGSGLACLSSGDTLQIRGGTYREVIDNLAAGLPIPSGVSTSAPTTIMAFPGETVWLAPSGVSHVIEVANRSYVVFDGIRVDGSGTNPASNPSSVGLKISSGAHHIRYTNGEIKNAGNGVQVADLGSEFNEISHSSVHDIG